MVRSAEVQDALQQIAAVIPLVHPATGWYFAKKAPLQCIIPEKDTWSCMFSHIPSLFSGEVICFSPDNSGCAGAACYLGFTPPMKDAGYFLAEKEKFKKSEELGNAFYEELEIPDAPNKYVLWQQLSTITNECQIEVVNLWVQGDGLSALVTLANYDRASNNNVLVPFSSGCQSIWTIPYREKKAADPKCIVGCMDPAVRHYLAAEVVGFSIVAERFLEMADNVAGSFLERQEWQAILEKNNAVET